MKLKLDEEGHAILEDGKPVYVKDDGTETAYDVAAAQAKISELNAKAAESRLKLEQAATREKLFKGLDPVKAREAIAFREALGDEIDPAKVTHEIAGHKATIAGLTTQVEELQGRISKADETIDGLTIGTAISTSEFVRTKLVPALQDPTLFRAAYGKHLGRDEDGNVVVKDAAGNTMMSEKNPGKPASPDEAFPKLIVNKHHLAPGNASGGGGNGNANSNGNDPGKKSGKWSELARADQVAAIKEYGSLKDAQAHFGE